MKTVSDRIEERRHGWRNCDKLELVIGVALATILVVATQGHMLPSGALALVGVGCLAGALLLVRRWRATEIALRKELQYREERERSLRGLVQSLESQRVIQDRLIDEGHARMTRMRETLQSMQYEYWTLVLREAERELATAECEVAQGSTAVDSLAPKK